jgi:NAD(P)-dependent dehydrogenase (short-subunit alcohol dehydrogenase family)
MTWVAAGFYFHYSARRESFVHRVRILDVFFILGNSTAFFLFSARSLSATVLSSTLRVCAASLLNRFTKLCERSAIMGDRLQGKVVIVTGAAQGIGFGCARLIASEGASVILADIQDEHGERAAETVRSEGGKALFCHTDVTEEIQCEALINSTLKSFASLDGLVNNAGWFPRATLEATTTELWDNVIRVNLRSAFYCCKYAVPIMRKAKGGSIVNMGSINGVQGLPNLVAYAAAKGGLLSLTRTLAGALAADRIRVNYVIPGWVFTEGEIALQKTQGRSETDLLREGQKLPLGRQQTALDVAYAVVYLLSEESSQVTGTVLSVDAGSSSLPIKPGLYPG